LICSTTFPSCEKCSKDQCKSCMKEYFLNQTKGISLNYIFQHNKNLLFYKILQGCSPCGNKCRDCDISGCTLCYPHYLIIPNKFDCVLNCSQVMPHCTKCESENVCTECTEGFFVSPLNSTECFTCDQDPSKLGIHFDYCFNPILNVIYNPSLRKIDVNVTCKIRGVALLASSINETVITKVCPNDILESLKERNEKRREESDKYWLEFYRKALSDNNTAEFSFEEMRPNTKYYFRAFCSNSAQTYFSEQNNFKSCETPSSDIVPRKMEHRDIRKRRVLGSCIVPKNETYSSGSCVE
jgi:hypothetical protein